MSDPLSDPYWNGLALVGMYLLHWGRLETALSLGFAFLAPDGAVGPEIDPDSISRTLSHLLTKWKGVCKHHNRKRRADIDALAEEISTASVHRNTICHGFQNIEAGEGPKDFTIHCYPQLHQTVMKGGLPSRLVFDRPLLIDLIEQVEGFRVRVRELTDEAQLSRDSPQAPTVT